MFDGEGQPLLLGGKKEPPAVFKYFVLLIISLICFGPYFAFDSIQVCDDKKNTQIVFASFFYIKKTCFVFTCRTLPVI